MLPDVPALALPTVPEAMRPLVRRILAAFKETQRKTELLDFLAARGWTTHPAEWMPAAERRGCARRLRAVARLGRNRGIQQRCTAAGR